MKWMNWNSVLVLGVVLFAPRCALVEGKLDWKDHPHIRGLVDLDRVPGLAGQHRGLQPQVCQSTQSVTTQGADLFSLGCMQEYPTSQTYGCTANDVRVANVTIKELRDANGKVLLKPVNGTYECSEGEVLSVDFTAEVLNGASSTRFDAAVFWSNGTDAKSGDDCSYTSFTAVGTAGGAPPNVNGLPGLELSASTNDTCGDMPGQTTDFADICGLNIICQDKSGTGGIVRVASCTTYKIPGANQVCNNTDPETFLPGSPSKCKCEFTEFPIAIKNPPTITKTCTNGVILPASPTLPRRVQWTVTVSIKNNNINTALSSWQVTDSPLAFDSPLSSATDGSIAAGVTKTYTRTITEALPSVSKLNEGFTDTVTLSSPNGEFSNVTATAACPLVCKFAATCTLSPISNNCVIPAPITNASSVFNIVGTPCGILVLTSKDNTNNTCAGTVNRNYTLLDDLNGNGTPDTNEDSAVCPQVITIVDPPPTLSAPGDKILECPANFTTGANGVANATDICENLTPVFVDTNTPRCGTTKTVLRTWSVKDKCNQTATAVQNITEVDTTKPVINNCPAGASVDLCSAVNLGAPASTLPVTDSCGALAATLNCCFNSTTDQSVRTWSVTDACGNKAVDCVQTVNITTNQCTA